MIRAAALAVALTCLLPGVALARPEDCMNRCEDTQKDCQLKCAKGAGKHAAACRSACSQFVEPCREECKKREGRRK